jgi:hypothetical protein
MPRLSTPPLWALPRRSHLFLNQLHRCGRHERPEQPADVVGEHLERKEAREGEQHQEEGEEREEEVIGELGREPEHVVVPRLPERAPGERAPGARHPQPERVRAVWRDHPVACSCSIADQLLRAKHA